MRARYRVPARWLGLWALLFALAAACAPAPASGPASGGISVQVQWPSVAATRAVEGAARPLVAPAGVTSMRFTVTAGGMDTITATFPATPGLAGNGVVPNVPVGTDRTLTIEGLDNTSAVLYQGQTTGISITSGQTTDAGTVTMAATGSTPSAPLHVATTAGNGQVTLTWEPPGNGGAATGYNVYWGTAAGVTTSSSVIPSQTSPYLHSGLANLTVHYYRVAAFNAWGEGPLSAELSTVPSAYTTIGENCATCHGGTGSTSDISIVSPGWHAPPAAGTEWDVSIQSVDTTDNNLKVTVVVQLRNTTTPVQTVQPLDVRFNFAQLVPGSAVGTNETDRWQSHYLRYDNGQPRYQRANDTTGVFEYIDPPTGTYSFTLGVGTASGSNGVVEESTPVGGLLDLTNLATYVAAWPQRIGVQISNGRSNAVFDWTPVGAGVQTATGRINEGVLTFGTMANQIVTTAACNACHDADGDGEGLSKHGGTRRAVEFCVTCHNPGSLESFAGNSVDFKVVVHKVHMGKELPSVLGGGSYQLLAHDYSKAGYPQEITNCAKCHTGGAQSGNWSTVPSREACGSCHDDVDFTTGTNHPQGPRTNAECVGCHHSSQTDLRNVELAHRADLIALEAARWLAEINVVDYNSGTGQLTVEFQVNRDTIASDLTSTPWTQGTRSRLAVNVGWKGIGKADYTNEGAGGQSPGFPISILVVDTGLLQPSVTQVGPGVYEVATTLPTAARSAGTGIVFIDGHPGVNFVPGEPTRIDSIPMVNALGEFAITDSVVDPRRSVVANDLSACANCHDTLTAHGYNRQGDARVCTACHSTAATDLRRRPASGVGVDNKAEETVNFGNFVHRIHAGARSARGQYVVYGFGAYPRVFAGELPLSTPLNDCSLCHIGNTYLPPLITGLEGTTVASGPSIADPADDRNLSPYTAVCLDCHDLDADKSHMATHGGRFDATEAEISY